MDGLPAAHEPGGLHTFRTSCEIAAAGEEAVKQGKVRFFGISSHDRRWHEMMVREFPILSVILFPYTAKTKEKPKELTRLFCNENGTVNASMGVYVFKSAALLRELEQGPGLGRRFDFGRDIIPEMSKRERVFLYPFQRGAAGHRNYWRDVGTLDSYFEATMDLLGPQPAFHIQRIIVVRSSAASSTTTPSKVARTGPSTIPQTNPMTSATPTLARTATIAPHTTNRFKSSRPDFLR